MFSLIFGSFFVPAYAKASFFSSLFGGDASASINSVLDNNSDANSQNMGLLQANVSSASVIQDKKDKNSKDKSVVDDTKEVSIASENALVPATGPAGVGDNTDDGNISPDQISVYVVREGDSIAKIADMFDVSPNTILWANDMKKGDKLVKGTVLIILPIDGVQVTVQKGQTLKSIAQKYKVDVSDIAAFNGIAEDAKLAVGDELIVPDAEMVDNGGSKPITKSIAKDKNYYKKYPSQNLGGYFVNPVPEYVRRSQGLHGGPKRNGVDLAAPTGTPIVAAAAGTVIFARNGYNGGYGNLTIISHPNGTETLYGHQSRIATHVGDQVSQGEIIGYVGNTGHSTGPHLHYEVHGARNNGLDLDH